METTAPSLLHCPSEYSEWQCLPDNILLHIFSYLPASSVLQASITCRCWYRVSNDEYLWRSMFYRHWQIDRSVPIAPGRTSWLQEYKRLYYRTPVIESEVIRQHSDQVLHVSFSHHGKMFATCSKDGYIRVWNALYPVTLKYKEDMKMLTWKYTQFSQFNESDTLLLVSGVHFGANSTSGEIAVFSLKGEFELQARVINKPYDVFGTWYNDQYLLSGNLYWTGQLQSCSTLCLNKASQETESEHESVMMKLYRFYNINASSIRTIMVADYSQETNYNSDDDVANGHMSKCTPGANMILDNNKRADDDVIEQQEPVEEDPGCELVDTPNVQGAMGGAVRHLQSVQVYENGAFQNRLIQLDEDENNDRRNGTIEYGQDYRQAQDQIQFVLDSEQADSSTGTQPNAMVTSQSNNNRVLCNKDKKNLTGTKPTCQTNAMHRHSDTMTTSQPDCVEMYSLPDAMVTSRVSDSLMTNTMPVYSGCNQHSSHEFVSSDKKEACREERKYGEKMLQDEEEEEDEGNCQDFCHSGIYMDGSVYGSPLRSQYLATQNVATDKNSTKYCVVGSSDIGRSDKDHSVDKPPSEKKANLVRDKYLVFTMGSETYTPHQIGIKRIKSLANVAGSNSTLCLIPNVDEQPEEPAENQPHDSVDKIIDMHGHIIGMCFSPDNRYLYVNNRPWPKNYSIENPLYPPPIAQEIDIHVIDLLKMKEVGTMHRSHKAYTPNDECFFIFLDVCKDYVASGAEDRHGYIWDRHYGVCLARFPHTDVVNSVAFNPRDTETLVTVSDDCSIKVWRSRSREHEVKVDNLPSLCTQS
ncbi:F-box/WD repeat-containing protein 5-like [Mizuhopecten yessoensis]|uniref:F-box/WD repeat-containing protein 5-like n=1 Tax=Mizuhopecten yessoensis TaxID=6573 RepID=UPI000B4584F9|nr:F-box/WD repeat-containing protein 5-like [Mizuhopecten yessoensis]